MAGHYGLLLHRLGYSYRPIACASLLIETHDSFDFGTALVVVIGDKHSAIRNRRT